MDEFVEGVSGGRMEFLFTTPNTPSFRIDGMLWGCKPRMSVNEIQAVLFGEGIHFTVECGKSISSHSKIILVTLDPLRGPAERRFLKKVPNGVGYVEGVFCGVRYKPLVENS
jgi:hypothetical protein